MASNRCVLVPLALNGKESKLFADLMELTHNRDMAKQIWAFTRTDLFRSEFTDVETDENGEPTADVVAEILDLDSVLHKGEEDLSLAVDMGITSRKGNPVEYSSPKPIMDKADSFNAEAKNKIAVVEKKSDGVYVANVTDRTPLEVAEADRNKSRGKLHSALISMLNRIGFDIAFDSNPDYIGIFDPMNAEQNAKNLKTVIRVSNNQEGMDAIPEEVAHLILAGMKNHPLKQRIDAAFTDDVVRRILGDEYNAYVRKYSKGKTPLKERLREEAEGKLFAALLKGQGAEQLEERKIKINQDEYTDEFRRLQEYSAGLSGEEVRAFHRGEAKLTQYQQESLAAVYGRLLSRSVRRGDSVWTNLTGKGNNFRIAQVDGTLFRDIFSTNRNFLMNGELVDLHGNYDNCKCFLTDDGLAGFAIEPDGNLISVFSLNPAKIPNQRGFLYAIADFAKEQGATHLDAYASENQNLEEIYKKTLGFQTASRMEYNMEYDHDDIAENHGNPDVVFMVDSSQKIEERKFGKDEYNEAVDYQKQNARKQRKSQISIPIFQRAWNWAKSRFRKLSEHEIDNAILEAQSSIRAVFDVMQRDDFDTVLDQDLIMKHEAMYELNSQMQKLADIAQEGETILSKKLYIIQNTQSKADTKALRRTINDIRDNLEKQKYVSACCNVLLTIGTDVKQLMRDAAQLGWVYNNTANLNVISSESALLNKITMAIQAYTPYLELLSTLPSLVSRGEVSMKPEDAESIAKNAVQHITQLNNLKADLRQMRFSVLKQLISLYYGDNGGKPENFVETDTNKWESVDMILSHAKRDISAWDTNLFSAGDSRNPLINVIHNIVVRQQAKRNTRINALTARMQEAEAKLHKAGYDNSFVYQYDAEGKPTGFYVAPVDMARYERERQEFIDNLDRQDLDYYEYQKAIQDWDDTHTDWIELNYEDEDGDKRKERLPRMEIYGNPNFQKGWSQAQKDYYEALMQMKMEMDTLLPGTMHSLYLAPQVRKSVTQMFDKDGKGALKTIWGNWKKRYSVVDDNEDYGKDAIGIGADGKKYVLLDFAGNHIKRVPIYFIHKLKDQQDLSTDATHAMFNYITMAVNYAEMGKLANAMQLLQEHVREDYEVGQEDAGKPMVDMFRALGRRYQREYRKTGEGTRTVEHIIRYIDRQFFNETKNKLGNVEMLNPFTGKNFEVSKDSCFNLLLYLTSVSRMGLNVLSGITNASQGEAQMLTEAVTGRYFGVKDLAWSKKEYAKMLPEYMGRFNDVDRHDKMYMLINTFNSSEDFFRDMKDKDFNKSAYKRVLGRGNIYFLNSMGEHYLHTSGMLMVLNHEKVKRLSNPNEEVSLYDVIKQVHDENGWRLELDDDIEFVNKDRSFLMNFSFGDNPAIVKKSDRDKLFENLAVYINKLNADMHGGYSEAEKGNANQQALWRAVLQFRQWMFGMYNKLYSGSYYDAVQNIQREGGYVSMYKFVRGVIADLHNMSLKEALENNKLSVEEKQNVGLAAANAILFTCLMLMVRMTAGWKDKDDRALRMLAYQVKRLELETGALNIAPLPHRFIKNIFTLIQSPAAGIDTLESASQLLNINAYLDDIDAGRYKGWPRALKSAWALSPIYNIQKVIDMKDYNYMFNIFG